MTRDLKIQPKFPNYGEVTSAVDVKILKVNFVSSTHVFAGIGEAFPNLKQLNILEQSIKFIERENFINLTQLVWLSFWENKIEFLPEDVFYDLLNLKILGLDDNRIKKLPEKIFSNLRKIETIRLDNNTIEHLPRNLFENNADLKNLFLLENPLKTVDVNFIKLTKLYNFDLTRANCVDFYARNKLQIPEVQQIISQNCTCWL